MFWDRVAGIYDIFVNVINSKTHRALCKETESLFDKKDRVLECACGTGMLTEVIASECMELTATGGAHRQLRRGRRPDGGNGALPHGRGRKRRPL